MPAEIFDISPCVSARLGVFPGDTPFGLEPQLDFEKGHNLRLSKLTSTLHLGAHVDAPSHYAQEGVPMSEVSLFPYLGSCRVMTASSQRGARVSLEDLTFKGEVVLGHGIPESQGNSMSVFPQRVLIRTASFPDPEKWNSDFCSLEPSVIETLAELGVVLVGIDTPSIDPEDSKDLPSHCAIARHKMAILEGVVLHGVPDGDYELIALPLRLEGADASPVRAILRRL